MKLPNKVIPYKNSILSKLPLMLKELEDENKTPAELYKKVNKKVASIAEFTSILSCLYALDKIELSEGGTLDYVKRN